MTQSPIVRILLFLALATSPALVEAAAVQAYSNRAAFEAAIDAQPIIDFESHSGLVYNGSSVDVGPLTISQDASTYGQFAAYHPYGPPDMNNGTVQGASYVNTGNSLYFTFDEPVTAFGADFRGINDAAQRTHFLVAGETIAPQVVSGAGAFQFLGFTLDVPFTEVRLMTHGASDAYSFDNVTFETVPEPATLAMALVGLSALVMRARRKSRRAKAKEDAPRAAGSGLNRETGNHYLAFRLAPRIFERYSGRSCHFDK